MATIEELFISFSPQVYKKNKSAGLMSQSYLLVTLKHLRNLKVLSRQKNDLKKQLYKFLSSLVTQIDSIQNKMPTPKVPKQVRQNEIHTPREEKIFSKKDEIEDELREIHMKLQQLNA